MKLLFLANRVPYPPYRGDKLKIYNLARRLCKGHELHLLTFAETAADREYEGELKKIFKAVHIIDLPKWKSALNCLAALWDKRPVQVLYFQSNEMKDKLAEVLQQEQFNAVHVQHLRMAPYMESHSELPRILDLPDAFSLYWERRKSVPRGFFKKTFETEEQKRVLRYEAVIKKYNLSLCCSTEDLAYLEQQHHTDNMRLLPNGVDLDTFHSTGHDYSHNHTLLFTGNMDYAPNVDAVCYFAEEIFPRIQQRFPAVKFIIAGQRPVPKVAALAGPAIEVTGFVKDIAAVYNTASVVIAPLRFGAGTQNKVLEAMAMGVPVVCSHIGFGGLGITSGEGAFMETTPDTFADRVIALLSSESLRNETGTKGKQVILSHFSWDSIAERLNGYFKVIAKQ